MSALSFIGSLLILITFLSVRYLRKHPWTMVFFLALCDAIFSLKYIVSALLPDSGDLQNNAAICAAQAYIVRLFIPLQAIEHV